MRHLRLAVLLSGSGTTLENLLQKRERGELSAEVAVVISSRADAYGLERARTRHIPALAVERKQFKSVEAFSNAVFEALAPYRPDLICTAGFLSLLQIPSDYTNRVINIHPSLLPSFGGKGYYGHHVHDAVLKHGCKMSGCTVHFVDNVYDAGPIILQKAVPVLEDDTAERLAERVQEAERELYPQAVNLIADERVKLNQGRVRIV